MLNKYSSYVLCLLISFLVVALYINDFAPLVRLEWKIQDILYSFRGKTNYSSDIVLVNIDDKTLSQYGRWPWHRDKIGDLLAAVGSGQPKTVLLDVLFDQNVNEDTLGYTKILAGQMSWMNNVILPYEIIRGDFRSNRLATPKYLYNSSVQVNSDLGILDENSALLTQKAFLPPDELCQYAAGLGFRYSIFDSDRKVRWEPLISYYEGYYYPSAALLAAASYLGFNSSGITVYGGKFIKIGGREIPTNNRGQLFINFNKAGSSFAQISAADILNDQSSPASLKDKLVIISVTADQVADFYPTPVTNNMSATEKTANVIENIVHHNYIKRMDSSPGTDLLILFLLGGAFAFVLPRVSLLYRLVILVVVLFLLANLNFILFNSFKILMRSLYIGLEVILLVLASPILNEGILNRLALGKKPEPAKAHIKKTPLPAAVRKDEPAEKQVSAGQTQGKMPTSAMEAPLDRRAGETSSRTAAGTIGGMTAPAGTVKTEKPAVIEEISPLIEPEVIDSAQAPKDEVNNKEHDFDRDQYVPPITPGKGFDPQSIRNLGRYRIVEELGKGAMGTVYKGVDPAINRNVALKTIRLDFVHDPEELEELKERLFREARAAGKLSHPNIVTIYDVGNEGMLQYIAMEYLQGQTLEDMIRRRVKFNYRIIAQIISQICLALDYAHSQGIVHRDIKPANIMVLNDYTIKVMDFGIARVDSSSMTRTGVAMGTPNYISPEQLQGKPVDHRTDIFSLGVMMYEMLVHRRPFRGENLTTLIYNIVNAEPEPPSAVDKAVPLLFDRVVMRALHKNPDERYQKAGEVALALADFIETFSPKRPLSV
ncbi:Protein kinase [Candidatus Zixiibacteriota bacterium]|nr:Protein kinase [candidate division Zixibacteria bacterium]